MWCFKPVRVKPNYVTRHITSVCLMACSADNQRLSVTTLVCQQSWWQGSLLCRPRCLAETITSTRCTYPQGMARLSWPGWLV